VPHQAGGAAGTLRAHAARVLGCSRAAILRLFPAWRLRRALQWDAVYWSADRNVDQTMAQNRTFRQAKGSCNTIVTGSLGDLDLVPILATGLIGPLDTVPTQQGINVCTASSQSSKMGIEVTCLVPSVAYPAFSHPQRILSLL